MNLRLGRFGRQESACAVGLAALISGIFSVNVSDTFAPLRFASMTWRTCWTFGRCQPSHPSSNRTSGCS